ncbi:methyltransferase [Rhizobium ruizarguesonis]
MARTRRNTQALLARGAVEVAAGRYPLIVFLHFAWIAGLWRFAWNTPIRLEWLVIFAVFQVARLWTLFTLGRRWITRIIVVPGEVLVAEGPYRFVRHPNYVVVVGEIATLPLCIGLSSLALLFSVANAMVLTIRIRAEDDALAASVHS